MSAVAPSARFTREQRDDVGGVSVDRHEVFVRGDDMLERSPYTDIGPTVLPQQEVALFGQDQLAKNVAGGEVLVVAEVVIAEIVSRSSRARGSALPFWMARAARSSSPCSTSRARLPSPHTSVGSPPSRSPYDRLLHSLGKRTRHDRFTTFATNRVERIPDYARARANGERRARRLPSSLT